MRGLVALGVGPAEEVEPARCAQHAEEVDYAEPVEGVHHLGVQDLLPYCEGSDHEQQGEGGSPAP